MVRLGPRLMAQVDAVRRWTGVVRNAGPQPVTLADIGSDHGLVTIEALSRGLVDRVIATDVAKGPLSRTRRAVERAGLGQHVDFRLGDGLDVLGPHETSLVLIGGLGGLQVIDMLARGQMAGPTCGTIMILQPMTHLEELRLYLLAHGSILAHEQVIPERGHYYQLIVTRATRDEREGLRKACELDQAILREFGFDPCLRDLVEGERADTIDLPALTRVVLRLGPLNLLDHEGQERVVRAFARDRLRRARRALRHFERGGGTNAGHHSWLRESVAAWERLCAHFMAVE